MHKHEPFGGVIHCTFGGVSSQRVYLQLYRLTVADLLFDHGCYRTLEPQLYLVVSILFTIHYDNFEGILCTPSKLMGKMLEKQ